MASTRNIYDDVYSRQCGRKTAFDFKQSVLSNRAYELTLSENITIEVDDQMSAFNSIDVDISGRYLLSGGRAGHVFIHDLFNFTGKPVYQCRMKEGKENFSGIVTHVNSRHTRPHKSVETVQWYPFDAGLFVTSGMDCALRIWDVGIMSPLETLTLGERIFQHHMSPVVSESSPLISVASSMENVILVDLKTGQRCHELRGHVGSVLSCRWSPTERFCLATGGYDSTIRIWDTRAGRSCLAVLDMNNRSREEKSSSSPFKSHSGLVNGLSFSPNGRLLMSLGTDNKVRCWNMNTMKNLHIPYGDISVRKSKSVTFSIFGYKNKHYCFIPDNSNITVLELETGNRVNTLRGHYHRVNTCYFHKHNLNLYSGGDDRNILIWSVDHNEDGIKIGGDLDSDIDDNDT